MPQIDWESHFSTAPPLDVTHKFLETLNDCFLVQHVTQPTRFRFGETLNILDLILTNEEGMVENLYQESGLGKSDHVVLRFGVCCYTYQVELPTAHPNYFKGNPDKYIKKVQEVDWESMRSLTVNEKYTFMSGRLKEIALQCFPRSKTKGSRKKTFI